MRVKSLKQLQHLDLGVIDGDTIIPIAEYTKNAKPKKRPEPQYGTRTDPITIILEGERPISWNVLYAGGHWNIRKREADRVHGIVAEQLHGETEYFAGPVKVTCKVYFDENPFDSCNIPVKMYIDGVIGYLFHDDSMEYVASNEPIPLLDPDRPRVELHVHLVNSEIGS